jgi:hypothetical protein
MISTSEILQRGQESSMHSSETARNRMVFRSETTPLSAHADTEDKELRKDPLGGPCFEGTLRKRCCLPNEVPWPGRLRTSFKTLSANLDAGRDREFHKNDRLSHTSALGEVFIAEEWKKVQGEIKKNARIYQFNSQVEVERDPESSGCDRMDCRRQLSPMSILRGCKLRDMKKQASDQSFHDRRYQERKRAEAAKKVAPKKAVREEASRQASAVKPD